MKLRNTAIIALSVSAMTLAGCMQEDGTRNNIVVGAGTGAAVGGILGRAVAKDKAAGTRNGAILGAVVGGVIGNELEKQEAELKAQMGGSGASIVNTGDRLVVTLPEAITFPTNGTDVKSSLYGPLATIAKSLNNYPNTIAQVVGHTDTVGDTYYNQNLSEQRARSVASLLVNGGVSSSRVTTVGRGETSPIASNDTEAGRQANRRVEINIIPTQ